MPSEGPAHAIRAALLPGPAERLGEAFTESASASWKGGWRRWPARRTSATRPCAAHAGKREVLPAALTMDELKRCATPL